MHIELHDAVRPLVDVDIGVVAIWDGKEGVVSIDTGTVSYTHLTLPTKA